MRRRHLLAALSLSALSGCTIGGEPPSGDSFRLSIPALDGGDLPQRYTCDGVGESPPVSIEGIPAPASSVALVGEWLRSYTPRTIWLLWGLPAEGSVDLPAGIPGDRRVTGPIAATQGQNDEREIGYRSPCHETPDDQEYRLVAYALTEGLDLEPGADRDAFDAAIEPRLDEAPSTTVRFRYERF
ncbi:YbhB/YbcL family Raf kinase inhibitor-like protein [Natronomonas sp.]|uniref:YbhB/YbcL family Raf kinase inhibitor-like protein n=1 Tax=Natronomonas sp. TaxID=2184060 RepID=UPI002628A161|nr:YbhB/YbcL family Raf kinase inhibitor-like protein [Natronomonas sp.]